MRTVTNRFCFALLYLPLLCATSSLAATPQARTYISGAGNDSNPCSATSPCQTLQAALTATLAGGQIFVLDSANYGPATITQSVSITSEGAAAGSLATSGSAITINAGANDVINLRGLDIDGGNSAAIGIQFNSGSSLNIQKSAIRNFTRAGISFTPSAASSLVISDTIVTGNSLNGMVISPSPSVTATAVFNRVTTSRNGVGILSNRANVTIVDAIIDGNTYGFGAGAGTAMIRNASVTNNTIGVIADVASIVRIGMSTVTANGTGLLPAGGRVESFGNNIVGGNSVDGGANVTLAQR